MDWATSYDSTATNSNLKNSLVKQKEYRIETRKYNLKIKQSLHESTLSLDIPCYLLDLWSSFFRDASISLIELFAIIKSDRINGDNFSNNTENFITSIGALINRLNGYGDFFEKYIKTTKGFAQRDEKIKKSVMKTYEDLMFIPVNLHLEQFDVESQYDGNPKKQTCHDFTSVGAFTTVHVNKSTQYSAEALMCNESSKKSPFIIKNEVTLVFFSLKIFIYLLNDLSLISKTEDKLEAILRCSKNLETISRSIIPSYQFLRLKRYEKNRAAGFALTEQFKYLHIKFDELVSKVKQTEFHNLEDFLFKVTEPIIELYNIIFNESISEKVEFLYICSNFSHSLTVLISSLDMKYYNNPKYSEKDLEDLYNHHIKNGILFQVESLLSCASAEYSMMFEHYAAIESLNDIHIHFPAIFKDFKTTKDSIYIVLRGDGYHVYFYSNFESASKAVKVYPVMFNVAINENAFSANFLGNNMLQKYINSTSIIKLRKYYESIRDGLQENELKSKLDTFLKRLETNRAFIEDSRPVELLHIVAEITRLVGGIRVTNCKSGKDRTGVSVSLEQCFILVREHNLDNSMMQYILDDLRRNGTRMDVVRKNVGQKMYAFNKIRYFLLPQLYQPPVDLCGDLDT